MANTIEFNKAVFSDAGLTTEISGPFEVRATTKLPNVFFSDTEYVSTAKNSKGELLWTCRFTYPTHITTVDGREHVSTASGGIFDE